LTVNWNEPELQRWLGTTTKKGTRKIYKMAFRRYAQYTGMTAKQMIDEALEDSKRGVREKKDILKTRLLGFYQWLQEEYPVKSTGKGKQVVIRKGVREKTAHTWVMAIRSFYGTFDLYVKLKGRQRLPKPRVYNKRMALNTQKVKALLDHARSPRDRAIILTMFQGGMDVSTLCDMKYGDVAEGLDTPYEKPLKVDLFRKKTGTEYYTFLGRDAVNSIKAYVRDARSRGVKFSANTPLFVKSVRRNGRIYAMDTHLVQKVLRTTARRSGLVDENNNGKDMSPVNPHALREAFGSIMTGKGVDGEIVDFWLGHEIGEMAETYKRAKVEDLRQMYAEREQFISVTVPETQLVDSLRKEMEERYKDVEESNRELLRMLREERAKVEDLTKNVKPLSELLNVIREVFGEENAMEELKKLLEANRKAVWERGENSK